MTSHERGVLTGIVTSYSLIVLAHANWRKGDLHEWITTVNNDFSPHGIHSLACKNYGSGVIYILFHKSANKSLRCSFLVAVHMRYELAPYIGFQAPVPLTIFRSNSKLDQNLKCSSLKCTLTITTKFCTRRVQNFFAICWTYFKLQHPKFLSNFTFNQNY